MTRTHREVLILVLFTGTHRKVLAIIRLLMESTRTHGKYLQSYSYSWKVLVLMESTHTHGKVLVLMEKYSQSYSYSWKVLILMEKYSYSWKSTCNHTLTHGKYSYSYSWKSTPTRILSHEKVPVLILIESNCTQSHEGKLSDTFTLKKERILLLL